jgi:hypothetical protein
MRKVPGGLQLFQNRKLVLDARWIKTSPPVLYYDGKILIDGADTSGSIAKLVSSLIHHKQAAWSPWIPRAFAAEQLWDHENALPLFMLASSHEPTSAPQFLKDHSAYFPNVDDRSDSHSTDVTVNPAEFRCPSANSDEKYTFQTTTTPPQTIVLKASGPNQFSITGIDPNKKFYVDYQLMYSEPRHDVYEDTHDPYYEAKVWQLDRPLSADQLCTLPSETSLGIEDLCKQGWDEYLEKLGRTDVGRVGRSISNDFFSYNCDNLGMNPTPNACHNFWKKKTIRQMNESGGFSRDHDQNGVMFSRVGLCKDMNCKKDEETYVNDMPTCSYYGQMGPPDSDDDNESVPASDKGKVCWTSLIDRAVLSAKVLEAGCHDPKFAALAAAQTGTVMKNVSPKSSP